MFLSARNSQVDVVQSVGRVMRKSPGKKYGYIIIPVVVPTNVDVAKALDDNERYKEVYKDVETVNIKAIYLAKSLRREAVKSKSKYVQRVFEYKSRRLNQWLIIVDYYVKQPIFTVVVYYLDPSGLNGIMIDGNNQTLTHFTPHFLERYNERFLMQPNISKIELLKRFVPKNSLEVIRVVPDSSTIEKRIFGRFKEGIGLGFKEEFHEIQKEIYHFKTFISTNMIFESQEEDFNLTDKRFDLYWNEMFKNTRRCA